MKKKYTKNNTKLINTIIIIGIICLIISLVIMLKNNKKIDNHIVSIDYNKYSELINEDKYNVILFTTPTCSHCKNYKPSVNQVCDKYNLVVYDLDISKLSYEEYILIHDNYNATKDNYINDNPSILTPTTIITKNGEEIYSISNNLGYTGFIELLKTYEIIKE